MSRNAYFFTAKLYDIFVEPFNAGLRHIQLKMCPPVEGKRILEIGCGTGTNLKLYQKAGAVTFGVDLSHFMLKAAQKKLGGSSHLQLANAQALPYPDDFFDVSLAMLTLHEMPPSIRETALDEMIRTLKPNGCLLITDFCKTALDFPKGWWYRGVNLFFEIAGGYHHFQNYRNFMKRGGLKALVQSRSQVSIEEEKIVSGGNLIVLRGLKKPGGFHTRV